MKSDRIAVMFACPQRRCAAAPAAAATCESLVVAQAPRRDDHDGAVGGGRGVHAAGRRTWRRQPVRATCRRSAASRPRSSRRATPTSRSRSGCRRPAGTASSRRSATAAGTATSIRARWRRALRRGYATASTDTGHEGGGGPWMQSQEKLVDYGHRAVHEMAVKAKAIINGVLRHRRRSSRTSTAARRADGRDSRPRRSIPTTSTASSPARPR